MHVTAIIAAAGSGSRLGSPVPKQLLELDGRTILERSVEAFLSHRRIAEVIVVLPPGLAATPPPFLAERGVRVVPGGARRQDSVANAFRAVRPDSDLVVVHDAARPFVSEDLISRTIEIAASSGAAIAAQPVRDTVKRAAIEGHGAATILETIPRETIFLAQTPQAFRRDVLAQAIALGEAGADATDEASLAERAGHPVRIVEGPAENVKITTPDDLEAARRRVRAARSHMRIGTGYDLHRLVEGRPLVLAGVQIPSERGALGHSDADVVCHAATDAMLGALSLGDIGRHFPDTDPAWKDASSIGLLRQATALVRDAGYQVVNLDVVVVLERPKIAPYLDRMRAGLADVFEVAAGAVSVKGKTNEGVDAVGRGEAVAAHAVALLTRSDD